MSLEKKFKTYKNPDLSITKYNLAAWAIPENRRHGFHNLYRLPRYSFSVRAPEILDLERDISVGMGFRSDVKEMTQSQSFSAMVVLKGQRLLYENYAGDFHPNHPHTLMSISKLTINLICGQLISNGSLDVLKKVKDYIPNIGSGYAEATVQQVLNMDLENNYSEDYSDPLSTSFEHETSLGWRLPSENINEQSQKEFLCTIESIGSSIENDTPYAKYKSANTDVLAWICEEVSQRPLRDWIIDIVEATGIEGNWYMHTDREGFPVTDGGVNLNCRDLARFGQLFCRYGLGVNNKFVGNKHFIQDTIKNPGPPRLPPEDFIFYSNQAMTNKEWIGHGGYGGQFLLANPKTGISVAFFSVLENSDALDNEYKIKMVEMMSDIATKF